MRVSSSSTLCLWSAALVTVAVVGCAAPADTAATAPAPVQTAAPAPEASAAPAPAVLPSQAPGISAAPVAAAPTAPPARRAAAAPAPARVETPRGGPPSASGAAPSAPAAAAPAPSAPPAPVFTEITVPSGTTLAIALESAHASDTSQVEETVRGVLRRALVVDGVEIAPAGAALTGHVTAVERSGRVKGLARLALRFSSIVIDDSATAISTASIARVADSTKKADAAKIGIGAGAGAVIGAITGGKKGAVVGGTVGAGAGTGVVLATRGEEVELAVGTAVSTTLSRPLVVRVRVP